VSQFLLTLGPFPSIACTACHKTTLMHAAQGQIVTPLDIARYKRTHVCGDHRRGWDVEDPEPAERGR
jgi:hypothetical protein